MSRSQRRPSLVPAALAASFALGLSFFAIAAAYVALLMLYSAMLKHIVILDVLTIAAGFTLRAAGAAAIHVPISHWLLIARHAGLFIALSKRRHELTLLTTRQIRNPERLHALPARSDDFGRHRVDPRRLRVLHDWSKRPRSSADL